MPLPTGCTVSTTGRIDNCQIPSCTGCDREGTTKPEPSDTTINANQSFEAAVLDESAHDFPCHPPLAFAHPPRRADRCRLGAALPSLLRLPGVERRPGHSLRRQPVHLPCPITPTGSTS